MAEPLRTQITTLLHRLDHLMRDGGGLRDALSLDPSGSRELELVRLWQRECAETIGQLSGGNKGHWLSRAYSHAFLLSAGSGQVATGVPVTEIVDRILKVLAQASASLSQAGLETVATASREVPSPVGRFDLVRDLTLRSHLEQAYADSQHAYERGDFALAFVTSCSLLEAIITNALERADRARLSDCAAPDGGIASWPFELRIAVAEKAALISAGCARLPVSARRYRDLLDGTGELRPDAAVSDREAKLAAQVLKVIIRDLAPGR